MHADYRATTLQPESEKQTFLILSVIIHTHTSGFRLKFRSCCIISNKYRVWSDVYDNGYKKELNYDSNKNVDTCESGPQVEPH